MLTKYTLQLFVLFPFSGFLLLIVEKKKKKRETKLVCVSVCVSVCVCVWGGGGLNEDRQKLLQTNRIHPRVFVNCYRNKALSTKSKDCGCFRQGNV